MLNTLLSSIIGKKGYQGLFEKFYNLGIRGMNYGFGGSIQQSGEIEVIKYIRHKLEDKTAIVFDVGANVGNYTKELLGIFERLNCHCFEPSKATFGKLYQNVSSSPFVQCHNFGFGKANAVLELFSDKNESGLASLYKRRLDHLNVDMNRSESIEIRTIDDFCFSENINEIDFLKLDIEGHELAALEGAEQMIKTGKVKFIQFEFGGCNIDSRTFFQDFWYLLSDQYKFYRIVRNGLMPIPVYRESFEIFNTINYLAELK